ncbi:MAG: hypothetical protein K9L88_03375 [Chromatiaceae bacterium]|nr:hypothetical protein [Chromatiaceae bacterium]
MVADHLHKAALRHVREQGHVLETMQKTIDAGAAARRRLSDRCAEQERTIGELRERLAAVERDSTQLRNAVGRAAGVVR